MGKINGCLKCLFIFFNVLYAVLGCVLIFLMAKLTSMSNQIAITGSPSLGWGWLFAIGVFGVAGLGIYAGCCENSIALKIFSGFMGVGMIIMLICGIIVVVGRNKVKETLASAEVINFYLNNRSVRTILEDFQTQARCCGVTSVEDWDGNIPDSCECRPENGAAYLFSGGYVSGCKHKPQGASGPSQVYKQTCGALIFSQVNFLCQIVMGFFFGLAVTAVMGLLVSLLMIHQVRRHETRESSLPMRGY
ncbi:tetraspanin-8-like isoform 2-T2 [Spinachia spinachia]